MEESIGSKTKKSLYWNVALKIPYEIFRFVVSIIIARYLDPEDFGIVSIATLTIYYANSFTNFGFNQALIQRKEINSDHINSVFTLDIIISLAFSTVFYYFSGDLAHFFNSPQSENVIKVLSVVFLITTLHDLPYVLFRREIDFKLISIVDMVREISMSILTLVLAYYEFAYWSIVWGTIIPQLIAAVFLFWKSGHNIKFGYHRHAIKDLFSFSFWSFIQMQVYFLSSRIDRMIIGKFINPAMLGIYEKSKSLTQMPSESVGDKINTVLFSSFSRLQNDREKIEELYQKGLVVLTVLIFPIYFGMYSVSSHFVIVLLGEKWNQMIPIFEIMAIAGLFGTINGLISALAVGAGYLKEYTIRFFIGTSLLILGCLLFVDEGIEGVAWVFLAYTFILTLLSVGLINSCFKINPSLTIMSLLPATISGIVMMFLVTYLKGKWFFDETFINLTVLVLLGVVIYIVSILLFPNSLISKIRSRVFLDLLHVINTFRTKLNR